MAAIYTMRSAWIAHAAATHDKHLQKSIQAHKQGHANEGILHMGQHQQC